MRGDHTTPQTAHSHSDIYDTQNCWKRRHHTITLRLPVKPRSHNPFISVIEGKSKCAAGPKIIFFTYCSATLSIARCNSTLFIPQCLTLTQLFYSALLYQPRQAHSTMRCLNLKREADWPVGFISQPGHSRRAWLSKKTPPKSNKSKNAVRRGHNCCSCDGSEPELLECTYTDRPP